MSRVSDIYRNLNKAQKIQAVAAAFITGALVIAIPAYAWFTFSSKAETMAKIQEPNKLDIRAGDAEDVQYFELNDINIESITPDQPKCYVFCVVTESAKTYYDIQIAHTTNIPFSYKLYRAEEGQSTDPNVVEYTTHTTPSQKIYYKRKGEALELEKLNEDNGYAGRKLGPKNDEYYNLVYGKDAKGITDAPEIYAVAKYEQVKELDTWDPEHDFYILELGIEDSTTVEGFKKWNAAENNKETDIIYITASRTIK